MTISWDDLRFFLALAESRTLSRAAERLEVSQPTVGRRIRELESALGASLFERSPDGYGLTPAGEQILSLVENIDRDVHAIERRVVGTDQRIAGRVRISATAGLARNWLVPRLRKLTDVHSGLEIDLSIGIPLSDLLRREADVALRFGEPGSEELVGRRLGQISCGLYASRGYLEQRGEPNTVAALDAHDIIESTRDIEHLVQARALRRLARRARVVISADSVDTQVAAARAGFGIVALMTYMRIGAPELRRILASRFDLKLDLWLLTHADLRENARIRAVLDFLHAAFQEDRTLLTGESKDRT